MTQNGEKLNNIEQTNDHTNYEITQGDEKPKNKESRYASAATRNKEEKTTEVKIGINARDAITEPRDQAGLTKTEDNSNTPGKSDDVIKAS